MFRLAIQLDDQQEAFCAAASRIRDVETVALEDSPDGAVIDHPSDIPNSDAVPALFVGAEPPLNRPTIYPAFPRRFEPEVQAVRQPLDAGNLGRLGLVRLHVWIPGSQPVDDRAKIHAIDLALWFFGEQPAAVYSAWHECQTGLIHLGFPGGGMAMLDFTTSLPTGDRYHSLSLIGSHGAAYADDHRNRNLFFRGASPSASPPEHQHAFIQPLLEHFIRSIEQGHDARDAILDYRKAEQVVHQIASQA